MFLHHLRPPTSAALTDALFPWLGEELVAGPDVRTTSNAGQRGVG